MKRIILSTCLIFSMSFLLGQVDFRIADESPASAKPAGDKIHIVSSGETLYKISQKYGVSVDQIKSTNQLTSNNISQGQRLYISSVSPSNTASTANARVASTTPSTAARMSGSTPQGNYEYYVMKKGDDIFSISDTREISVAKLKEWNPEAAFVVGDRIVVGEKAASASPTPTANNQRVAYQPPSAQARVASSSVPTGAIFRSAEPAPAQIKNVAVPQQPVTSVRAKDGTVYEMPVFNIYGSVARQVRYGEVNDTRVSSTRFYAFHKSLPLGTKLNLLIPNNAGFVQIEVVGRLDQNSPADIGLSPACVELLQGVSQNDIVTITYN